MCMQALCYLSKHKCALIVATSQLSHCCVHQTGVKDTKSLEQLVVDLDATRETVPEKVCACFTRVFCVSIPLSSFCVLQTSALSA